MADHDVDAAADEITFPQNLLGVHAEIAALLHLQLHNVLRNNPIATIGLARDAQSRQTRTEKARLAMLCK